MDQDGKHVEAGQNYGFCIEDCPKHVDLPKKEICKTKSTRSTPGKKCVFPFTYNNETYNGCPVDPFKASEIWCSTKVDRDGKYKIKFSKICVYVIGFIL